MVKVLLVRHGETEHNKDDAITGQMDVGLNSFGVEQAEKAADRLENYNFDAAYSSDLERTYETVRVIAERHGLHPERFEEFRERNFGDFEGRPKDDWREKVRDHQGERHNLRPENGESLEQVGERFVGKLNDLQEKHKEDELILVGGHSVAIKAALMNILELKGSFYGKLSQSNTGLTEIEYSESRAWKLIRMNDIAHLEK